MSDTILAIDLGGTRYRAGLASTADPVNVSTVGEWPTPATRQQFIDQRLGDRFLRRGLVNLGHVALGGGLRVDEGAVVGHQQHAGGVMVEPADRLHVAPS